MKIKLIKNYIDNNKMNKLKDFKAITKCLKFMAFIN